MLRSVEDLLARTDLDDPPQIHHRDAVADMADHREIMRDEQIGEPELVLQVFEQVDHLRLDRDVERRNRLVEDQQFRVERQSPGDADALALAARKLMRKAVAVLGRQPDQSHQLGDPRLGLRSLHPRKPQRLGQDGKHRHQRVERGERVLEHVLHVAPHRGERRPPAMLHRLAVKDDLPSGRLLEPDDAAPGGGFAATGFPHQPECLAGPEGQADAVDRLDRRLPAAPHAIMLHQVVDLEQRLRSRPGRHASTLSRLSWSSSA